MEADELLSWHRILNILLKPPYMKKIMVSLLILFSTGLLFAQEAETKNINVDINTDGGSANWYTSPWVWVVGAAIFILLLVALTRGGRRTH